MAYRCIYQNFSQRITRFLSAGRCPHFDESASKIDPGQRRSRSSCNLIDTGQNSNQFTVRKLFESGDFRREAHRYKKCDVTRDRHCVALQNAETAAALQKKKDEEYDQSYWSSFFCKKKRVRPPKECCRMLAAQKTEVEEIPDYVLEHTRGDTTIMKTPGKGYILETPKLPVKPLVKTKEDILLAKIESQKNTPRQEDVCNPMPEFESVGLRWIALQERKLHPFYKKYEMPPAPVRKMFKVDKPEYKYQTGSPDPNDLPARFKNVGLQNQSKIVFSEYKMVELPRQMINKMKEIEINMHSPLEYRPYATNKEMCKEKGGPRHMFGCNHKP